MARAYDLPGGSRFVPIEWQNPTLNTVPRHNIAVVECLACEAIVEFERDRIPETLHHSSISDIEARMKCKVCEAKAARLMFGYLVAA